MSEIGDELLNPKIDKKRVLGVILIAALLISVFAFSTVLINMTFGRQRSDFDDQLKDKDYEDAPPLEPFNPFEDLLEDLNLTEDLLDYLSDMFDGNIDNFDPSQFSDILPDVLPFLGGAFAEKEVFRVYNYTTSTISEMEDKLWKTECFDRYTVDSDWESTVPLETYDFYSYQDYENYNNNPNPLDYLKIKMPLSPNSSMKNSITLPNLFPTPFIIKNSLNAPNLLSSFTELYKNSFNCSTADLYFSSDDDINMTFNLFGLDLLSNDQINSLASLVTNPSFAYSTLLNKFTQIPPDFNTYKLNNPYFAYHYNILNNSINQDDNAFIKSNKIRNYLQNNFYVNYSPSPDPNRDIVDYFCETQQGLWPEFASAFVIFSRAFGVASRFVNGFNSRWIQELSGAEEGLDAFAIKYKNLYNWAEIYVPTDIYGNGQWVQMDILFDSYGPGGNPIVGGNYNITLTADKFYYNRPDTAFLNATLSSSTDPIVNKTITFRDLTSGEILGVDETDINGDASIFVNINNSFVVGPNILEARLDFFTYNYTIITILGNISITLDNLNPTEINRSDSIADETFIQGYVYDPVNGKRVQDAEVNFILFHKSSHIEEPFAFTPQTLITNQNGEFNTFLSLNPLVPTGEYEVRVDFNGTWVLYGIPLTMPSIVNSSNSLDLNITKSLSVWFYIDGVQANDPNNPVVFRYHVLNLTALVLLENIGPKEGKTVNFYDYSRGNIFIGSDTSNVDGYASILYPVDDYCRSGPNLLYANLGIQNNYSYFILNEVPTINIISGPNPMVINRTGSGETQFNVMGEIFDSTNNSLPIGFSEITLTLLKGGVDYSAYLMPLESYPYLTDSTGIFDLTFGVLPNTPPGNYSLRLDFNGTIDLTSFPYNPPTQFYLTYLSISEFCVHELKIEAESSLEFYINGIPSNDFNNPQINRGGDLDLTVYIHTAGIPIVDGELVEFYDLTENNYFIGSNTTSSGSATFTYPTGSIAAGPHLIYATWNNKYNFSYFILNDQINVNLDICPQPREIFRSGAINRNFIIHGYLNDSIGNPIRYGEISVHLMYAGTDYTPIYLNLVSGSLILDESGEIDLICSVAENTDAWNYTLRVDFNGTFYYTTSIYPYLFTLGYLNNSADGFYELKVIDPNDMAIYFYIDGVPTQAFYDDFNLPERYNPGDFINFSVIVLEGGNPASGTVIFTDVYTSSTLGSASLDSHGLAWIYYNTAGWYAGLHRIRAQWSGSATFNTTYIVLNDTVNIFYTLDKSSITRDYDTFSISGNVQESGIDLRGLVMEIHLYDSSYTDVSSSYLLGSQTMMLDQFGNYQFFNTIDLTCLQGDYYLRVEFNGKISEIGIDLSDYMIHNATEYIPIIIKARTLFINTFYDTNLPEWYYNDDLFVYGTLTWDNGTVMSNMIVNVTIRDGNGNILETKTNSTDINGFFNIIFTVGDWESDTEIRVYFLPEDNFGIPDRDYIATSGQQVFRQP
jgi:hypothetical protein